MNIRDLVARLSVEMIIAFIWWNPTTDGKKGFFTVTFERVLESAGGSVLYSNAFGLCDLECIQVASERAQHAIMKLERGEFDLDQPVKIDA